MSRLEFVSLNPATGERVWRGFAASSADVDKAVKDAKDAQIEWRTFSFSQRLDILKSFESAVNANAASFASLIAREIGKPLWEAKQEVASVASKIDISIDAFNARTGISRCEVNGVVQSIQHKPHGVMAVLGPYNFPAHLPNGHIAPALLAGNSIIFKPSELAPATGAFLADLWYQAGIPRSVLQVLQGPSETGRALASHPGLNGLLFTGSSATGIALHKQFAGQPDKVLALEMGGNNAIIAWKLEPSTLKAAAMIVVQSAYQTAGQRCTSARRLIVEDCQHAALLDAIGCLVDEMRIGDPLADEQPYIGPVISNAIADRLVERFEAMSAAGAKTIRPLRRLTPGSPFLTPGLIDVTSLDERPDEELFGPLLQVIRVKDFSSAIAEANRTQFGLSASLIGGDERLYEDFAAAVRVGICNWNRPTNGAASNAPFGGAGLSGNHRPSAFYAADYCAWPVAGMEAREPIATTPAGFGTGPRN